MQTLEYRTVDKSKWGPGPWQDEPDKKQWRDEATGLPCLIVRNRGGALCGYVGVSKGHPFYEIEYSTCSKGEACDSEHTYCDHSPGSAVEVHGGLTFSGHCQPNASERGICHLVEPGEDDRVWWLGFDCAHCYDISPGHGEHFETVAYSDGTSYKDVEYVAWECKQLAEQLSRLKP